MADAAQDKTEPATPRRRQEARAGGQVPKSTDLTAAVVLLSGVLMLYLRRDTIIGQMVGLIRHCLGDDPSTMVDANTMVPNIVLAFQSMANIALPVMLLVTVLALVSAFGQVGVLFTLKPMTPSLQKMNPISGLKRMFNSRAFVQLAMGIAKMSVLAMVAYYTFKGRLDALAGASALSHLAISLITIDFLFTLALRLTIALLILAIIDFIYQRWKHERDLRMTKEEIKEELKRMDGDPKMKRRRREVQLQLALQRIRSAVPQADVVITNPTSFAVVIQYDSQMMNAPKLTAKGADLLAQRIRELAIEFGVPIVERPPLARALYRTVEVGQEIPAQFYRAVAEVLAYVYELAGRGYRRRSPVGMAMN